MDRPLFAPESYGLSPRQAELAATARTLGLERFRSRAFEHDREATFPVANFQDLKDEGFLAICIPEAAGGLGADLKTYMIACAEVGRYCGATALTWNMHASSTLWTGPLIDGLGLSEKARAEHVSRRDLHYARIVNEGAIYSQPGSEDGRGSTGEVLFATKATRVDGGWRINGRKIFASLAGSADYYGVLCCEDKERPQLIDTMYVAVPAHASGVSVTGQWDPLGMRGTDSRTLVFDDVFVSEEELLLPKGVYQQAAIRNPHMFLTLTATYVGIAQAAFDFTVSYLRGEVPGAGSGRRKSATKQLAVAEMRFRLEQTKALWFQSISEARIDPHKAERLRAYAAQYTVMENVNTICQLAIRTCGGRSLFRAFPLERMYRDSRCGSLMLPWSAERCLEMTGFESLYEAGETDS